MSYDPSDIVAGLSRDQKHALRAAAECKGGEWWTAYRVDDTRLAQAGTLTPLGLACRAHLHPTSTPAEREGET